MGHHRLTGDVAVCHPDRHFVDVADRRAEGGDLGIGRAGGEPGEEGEAK